MSDIHNPPKQQTPSVQSAESKDKTKQYSPYFLVEEDILKYWKDNKIFERSIEQNPKDKRWTFLDGPPFISGMPHYGTLLSSIPKDLFGRYWTMKGYRVRRVWGWDCHGLPAENKVENSLGLKSKREIEEKVGVKRFIDECKLYVNNVSSEWEWYVDHIGRWVDFKQAYRTMDIDYMESVMWVFKQMYEKKHIYKGLRVSLYCPHCSTPISNFEVAMDAGENYKEVTEPANTYKYKVVTLKSKGDSNIPTFFLAWSTTPWTKITTTALAVNPSLEYVTVEYQKERYILAQTTLEQTFMSKGIKIEDLVIIEKHIGKELVGLKYEGHYDYYLKDNNKQSNIVVADQFVTADEGTGIVTLAPYGEEDMKVMQRDNIQIVLNVDDEGKLTPDNPNGWAGLYYTKVNALVNQDLTDRGLMFNEQKDHKHTIAHCWRCHTRLLFNPQEAWYVDVQSMKGLLRETNENINWYPKHFKYGRFLKSMDGAPDWCISRSRYWGSPVPVWECKCGERFVPGSLAELEARSGQKIVDLHKPEIDDIKVKCVKCGSTVSRVPEVLDSWIEAGSASFAERHFPFERDVKLEDFFPPDFITEYTGQIRAWFYVLHVISASIYSAPAFKNVLVSGVILGTDGRKMSKNYKNYPDPKEVIEKYGGDALRLYLLGSPTMRAEDINISEIEYRDQLRKFIIPLLNIWNFFETYAKGDYFQFSKSNFQIQGNANNVLDKWLVSRLHSTVRAVTQALEAYDTPETVKVCTQFVDDWSKWHVRRSRDRVGAGELTADAKAYYETTIYVFEIFLRLIAPIVPFHSEYIYQKLTGLDSVHLQSYPIADQELIHVDLEMNTKIARQICEIGHQIRKTNSWKVRQPLLKLDINIDADCLTIHDNTWQTVLDELNIKNIVINSKLKYPKQEIAFSDDQLKQEGELRDFIREVQALRKEKGLGIYDQIDIIIPAKFEKEVETIKIKVKAKNITLGQDLKIMSS